MDGLSLEDAGRQQARESAAGQSVPHESAALHVVGDATYVDDIAELAGTLYIALGLSSEAHARLRSINLDAVQNAPGVVAVITAADIPGHNDCGPIIQDDPILADSLVQFVGQPIFAAVASSYNAARKAVRLAEIEYESLPAVLDVASGMEQQSYVLPPMHLRRGDAEQALDAAPRREDGCFHLWCSTQHPTEMQQVVAHALGIDFNQVVVEMRRMGGGFGGKESQSAIFACIAAVAASKLKCPVKLRLDRDDDMSITGKRHGFEFSYDVGFDDDGLIHAASIEMAAQAGFSADLTGPVVTRAVCHFDNAYYLSDVAIDA